MLLLFWRQSAKLWQIWKPSSALFFSFPVSVLGVGSSTGPTSEPVHATSHWSLCPVGGVLACRRSANVRPKHGVGGCRASGREDRSSLCVLVEHVVAIVPLIKSTFLFLPCYTDLLARVTNTDDLRKLNPSDGGKKTSFYHCQRRVMTLRVRKNCSGNKQHTEAEASLLPQDGLTISFCSA